VVFITRGLLPRWVYVPGGFMSHLGTTGGGCDLGGYGAELIVVAVLCYVERVAVVRNNEVVTCPGCTYMQPPGAK